MVSFRNQQMTDLIWTRVLIGERGPIKRGRVMCEWELTLQVVVGSLG